MAINLLKVRDTSIWVYASVIEWHIKSLLNLYSRRIAKIIFLESLSIALNGSAIFMAGLYVADLSNLFAEANELFSAKFSLNQFQVLFPILIFTLYTTGVTLAYYVAKDCINIGAEYTIALLDRICAPKVLKQLTRGVDVPIVFNNTQELAIFSVRESRSGFVFGRQIAQSIPSIVVLPIVVIYLFYLQPNIAMIMVGMFLLGFPVYAFQSGEGARAKTSINALKKNLIEFQCKKIDVRLLLPNSCEQDIVSEDALKLKYKSTLAQQRMVIETSVLMSGFAPAVVVLIYLFVLKADLRDGSINVPVVLTSLFLVKIFFQKSTHILKSIVAFNRFFPSLRKVYHVVNPHGKCSPSTCSVIDQDRLRAVNFFSLDSLRNNSLEISRVIEAFGGGSEVDRVIFVMKNQGDSTTLRFKIENLYKSSFDQQYYNELLVGFEEHGFDTSGIQDIRTFFDGFSGSGLQDEREHLCLAFVLVAIASGVRIFVFDEIFEQIFLKFELLEGVLKQKIIILLTLRKSARSVKGWSRNFSQIICCSEYVRNDFKLDHICNSMKSTNMTSHDFEDEL